MKDQIAHDKAAKLAKDKAEAESAQAKAAEAAASRPVSKEYTTSKLQVSSMLCVCVCVGGGVGCACVGVPWVCACVLCVGVYMFWGSPSLCMCSLLDVEVCYLVTNHSATIPSVSAV